MNWHVSPVRSHFHKGNQILYRSVRQQPDADRVFIKILSKKKRDQQTGITEIQSAPIRLNCRIHQSRRFADGMRSDDKPSLFKLFNQIDPFLAGNPLAFKKLRKGERPGFGLQKPRDLSDDLTETAASDCLFELIKILPEKILPETINLVKIVHFQIRRNSLRHAADHQIKIEMTHLLTMLTFQQMLPDAYISSKAGIVT